jgi:hypothetical protein
MPLKITRLRGDGRRYCPEPGCIHRGAPHCVEGLAETLWSCHDHVAKHALLKLETQETETERATLELQRGDQ